MNTNRVEKTPQNNTHDTTMSEHLGLVFNSRTNAVSIALNNSVDNIIFYSCLDAKETTHTCLIVQPQE